MRTRDDKAPVAGFDQLVFYLEDSDAVETATRPLRENGINPVEQQHAYWDDNGGVTFLDPDGRGVIFVSWIYGPWLDKPQ